MNIQLCLDVVLKNFNFVNTFFSDLYILISVCEATEPTCHFCKRNSLPQYQATLPEGNILNFCSSQCVTKFQVRLLFKI